MAFFGHVGHVDHVDHRFLFFSGDSGGRTQTGGDEPLVPPILVLTALVFITTKGTKEFEEETLRE